MLSRYVVSAILLLSASGLITGCASQVTVSSNIRRSLPVIIDESHAGNRRFEAGIAYRTGRDEGETIHYFYQEAINQTFGAYDRSNATAYARYTFRQRYTLRMSVDDLGYSGDLAVRTKPSGLTGFASIGLTAADRAQVSGYTNDRPVYPRMSVGGSVAPLALDNEQHQKAAERFRLYGNLSWAKYPVWLDFTQTFDDTTPAPPLRWTIKRLETGEAKIASAGISYEGGRIVVSSGLQKAFGISEQAVRVDLGSAPPYLVTANPSSPVTWLIRAGVRF